MQRTQADLQRFLQAQRTEYLRGLPVQVERIEALWEAQRKALEEEGLRELERLAHTLFGSAGTFGFRAVSDAARALETAIEALQAGGAPAAANDVSHAIAALRPCLPDAEAPAR